MVIKVYVSGISGNKEVKKRQQRVLMILDSKIIKYEVVDIAEPGNEEAKEFMQNNSKSLGATVSDPNPRSPLPPQIFNDDDYCGDYDQFDMANEVDEIEKFLKMPIPESDNPITSNAELKLGNGEINSTTENETNKSNDNENESKENAQEDAQNEKQTENAEVTENASENAENNENVTENDAKLENGSAQEEFVSPWDDDAEA